MAELEVQLFGELQLRRCGQTAAALSARQQLLLAWLLLHPQAPQPRKQMAFALWPDSDEAQALTNLRRELHHLRQHLPETERLLKITPQTLHWPPSALVQLDVAEFEQALRAPATAADLERAAGLYTAGLLPYLDAEWLEPLRQTLHQQAAEVFEQLIGRSQQAGQTTRALHYAERLLTLEPWRESVYAQVMRLQLAAGDRAAARHTYERCLSILKTELGALPGEVVQAEYRRLQEPQSAEPPVVRGALPLIGRRSEWEQLQRSWHAVNGGASRVFLITGEAGIGKSRLAESLLALVGAGAEAGTAQARSARTRSYAAEGRLAYEPIRDWLRSPALQSALPLLEEPWQSELSRLMPERSPHSAGTAEPPSEGWHRQRLFEALARAFLVGTSPLLLLLDDLQWCDRDTLEWLHFLVRFRPDFPLLLLCTLRREEQEANPAVRQFLRDLQQRGLLQTAELGNLSLTESAALARACLEQELSPEAQAQLFGATEGQPLFIIEMLHAGVTFGAPGGPPAFDLSPRLQAVIATRLEQLSAEGRATAQLAATCGRAFDLELLRDASDLEEEALTTALDELWQRAMIREHAAALGSYDFTHDRLREGAYAELSPPRRRLLHRRVAQALELRHAEDLGRVAAQLAAHHEQAGQAHRAVQFYSQAAERANRVSASQETLHLAAQALRLLEKLPVSRERDQAELTVRNSVAAALSALKGFTPQELETTLTRALQLAEQLTDHEAVIRSLWGLYALHVVRGNVALARSLAERALRLAGDDTGLLTDSHQALGGVDLTEGRLAAARQHFAVAHRLYRQHRHRRVLFGADVGVFSLVWDAHGRWLQGDVAAARRQVAQAAAIADELGHPFTQMQARAYQTISHQLEGDLDACWESAEATVAGCQRYQIAYYHDWGVILGGWVLAQRGEAESGLARIKRGLGALQLQDAALRRPYYLALLAETQLLLGKPQAARAALDGAQAVARQNSDLWYLPELYRLRGLADPLQAEACFRRALNIATDQGSLSLALRAATSLAAHLQASGRAAEAEAALRPLVRPFARQPVTPDMRRALALL